MKKITIFFVFINTLFVFSQRDTIILPNGFGKEIEFSSSFITPIFSVYVNKNKVFYFEDKKINIEQLADSIFKYRNLVKPDMVISIITQIYADKNLSYKYIEDLKDQLSRASMHRIMYRTDNIEAIEKGLFVRLGKTTYPKIDKPLSKEALKELGIGKHPIEELEDELYNFNFKIFKVLIKNFNYKKVYFLENGNVKIDKEIFSSKEIQKVFKLLEKTDLFFLITSSKTKYEDYLKNLIFLANSYKENKKRFTVIEVTNKLNKKMKAENFNFSE